MPNVLSLGPGELRVVYFAEEVQRLSLEGYRLVAIENHEQFQSNQVEKVDQYGNVRYVQVLEKFVATGYVLHRDEESSLRHMTAELATVEAARTAGLAREKDLKEKLDKELAANARQGEQVELVKQARDFEKKTSLELRAKADKLEGHIGKLRKALGELRMKEILGE
jgi:hypothetical protein